MFEMFFNRGILDVVSVHPEDATANIYSYFPFTEKGCNTFEPVCMVQYVAGNFSGSVNLFPKNKLKDLYNCSVKVLLFPHPLSIPYPTPNTPIFTPKIGDLVKMITEKITKFNPVYSYSFNISEGIELLSENPKLLAPGGGNTIDRGSPMFFGCVTWCLAT